MKAPAGVLGVELDQGLVPSSFRDQVTTGRGSRPSAAGSSTPATAISTPRSIRRFSPPSPSRSRRSAASPAPATDARRLHDEAVHGQPALPGGELRRPPDRGSRQGRHDDLRDPALPRVEAHPTCTRPPTTGGRSSSCWSSRRCRATRSAAQQLTVGFHFTYRNGVAVVSTTPATTPSGSSSCSATYNPRRSRTSTFGTSRSASSDRRGIQGSSTPSRSSISYSHPIFRHLHSQPRDPHRPL